MTTSLSNHGRSAHPADGFDEDPCGGDDPSEARLRGLDRQQLADRLNWLSWYQPGIFAAVMDYGQFSDDLAADTDPTDDPDPLGLVESGAVGTWFGTDFGGFPVRGGRQNHSSPHVRMSRMAWSG